MNDRDARLRHRWKGAEIFAALCTFYFKCIKCRKCIQAMSSVMFDAFGVNTERQNLSLGPLTEVNAVSLNAAFQKGLLLPPRNFLTLHFAACLHLSSITTQPTVFCCTNIEMAHLQQVDCCRCAEMHLLFLHFELREKKKDWIEWNADINVIF